MGQDTTPPSVASVTRTVPADARPKPIGIAPPTGDTTEQDALAITGTQASAAGTTTPFSGVTIFDPSAASGAVESVQIRIDGAGEMPADGPNSTGPRSLLGGGGMYPRVQHSLCSLTGTAAQVSQEIAALQFTPAGGQAGGTTFVLVDRSSAAGTW